MQLVEKCSDFELSQSRFVLNDVETKTVFDKEDDLIQFQNVSNILVTSENPLNYNIRENNITFAAIPDLYPVKHTVTLPPEHFYNEESIYRKSASYVIYLHYS